MKDIREDNIRPEDTFGEFVRLSAHDAENFFDRSRFSPVNCPACGDSAVESSFVKYSFQYIECGTCNSLYNSPRPSQQETSRYYTDARSAKYWANEVLSKTKHERKASIVSPNVRRIAELVKERTATSHRIVDVGAANGVFLQEWKHSFGHAQLIAIEPGDEGASACRKLGARVAQGMIEDVAPDLREVGDIVTCFEVIEHVQDPLTFARSIHEIVAPNGCAIVTGLGVQGFDIQLLWEKSRSIMPPYHLNFLSVDGFERVFRNAGFDDVEIITPGRLDVEIVEKAVRRGDHNLTNRFEKLLMSKSAETKSAFQRFLAEHQLSSHVWAICRRNT